MRKRLKRKALMTLVILVVVLGGVLGIRWMSAHRTGRVQMQTTSEGGRVSGGTLKVGVPGDIHSLDPHKATEPGELIMAAAVTDPLFEFDPVWGISGAAAQSWEVEDDGHTYIIHLRPDLEFTDGTPCDAEAVVFNLRRMSEMGPPIMSEAWLGAISEIRTVDELTVRLDLRYPDANLPFHLSRPQTGLVSPQAVFNREEKFSSAPVGLGPFVVPAPGQEGEISFHAHPYESQDTGDDPTSYDPEELQGEPIRMRACSDFYRGEPYLDAITFVQFDPTDPPTDPKQEGLDVLVGVDPSAAVLAESLNTAASPRLDHHLLAVNLASEALSDVRVRQAIELAVDREELIQQLMPGEASPIEVGQTPFSSEGASDEKVQQAEPRRAEKLLREAEFSQKEPLVMLSDAAEERVSVSRLIARQLQQVDIEVELEVVDEREEYYHRMRAGEYDISYWVLLPAIADLSGYTANMRTDSYWNVSQIWNSPCEDLKQLKDEIDDLLTASASSVDAAERQTLLEEFFSLADTHRLFISLWHTSVITGYTDGVGGIHHPYGYCLDFLEAHFIEKD